MGKIPSISFANVNNFRTLRAWRRGGGKRRERREAYTESISFRCLTSIRSRYYPFYVMRGIDSILKGSEYRATQESKSLYPIAQRTGPSYLLSGTTLNAAPIIGLMRSRASRLDSANDKCGRFKSAAQAPRFLSVYGVIRNFFRVGRHLLESINHRILRPRSLHVWNEVTCAR